MVQYTDSYIEVDSQDVADRAQPKFPKPRKMAQWLKLFYTSGLEPEEDDDGDRPDPRALEAQMMVQEWGQQDKWEKWHEELVSNQTSSKERHWKDQTENRGMKGAILSEHTDLGNEVEYYKSWQGRQKGSLSKRIKAVIQGTVALFFICVLMGGLRFLWKKFQPWVWINDLLVTPTQEFVTGLEIEEGVNASFHEFTRRKDLFSMVPCREPPPLSAFAFQCLCFWGLLFWLFVCPVWRNSNMKREMHGGRKLEWEHHDGAHVKWTSERVWFISPVHPTDIATKEKDFAIEHHEALAHGSPYARNLRARLVKHGNFCFFCLGNQITQCLYSWPCLRCFIWCGNGFQFPADWAWFPPPGGQDLDYSCFCVNGTGQLMVMAFLIGMLPLFLLDLLCLVALSSLTLKRDTSPLRRYVWWGDC
jgi:hypothetical protein